MNSHIKNIFLIIVFAGSLITAQNRKTDSLKVLLSDAEDRERVDLLLDLATTSDRNTQERYEYGIQAYNESKQLDYPFGIVEGAANVAYSFYFDKDYQKAVDYFSIALIVAKQKGFDHLEALNNHRLGLTYHRLTKNDSAKYYFKNAIAYWEANSENNETDYYYSANNLGLIYWRTSVYDSAITYYRKAQKMAMLLGDKKRIAAINNNLGVVYWQWGIYDRAIEYYSESLAYRKELKDSVGMVKVFNNLGRAYLEHGNYELASEYFDYAYTMSKEIGNLNASGYSLNNIGAINIERGNYEIALENYSKSLDLYKQIEDAEGITLNYNDISHALNKLGRNKEAIEFASDALKFATDNELKLQIGQAYRNLGDAYSNLGKYSQAITYLDSAKIVADESGNNLLLRDAYKSYAETYHRKGDWENYAEYLNLHYEINEKILNDNSSNRLLEFRTRLETIESQKKLKEQEYKLGNRMLQLYVLGGSVIFLLMVLFIIYRINASRKKAYEYLNQKNRELDELNITKDKILSVIAHDLKNPMGNVLNYSQFLIEDYDDMSDTERKESARGILTSIKIVFEQLDNLLTWTRSQRGLIEINPELFDLEEITNKLKYNLAYTAIEKDITLDIDNSSEKIFTDRFSIETILNNLVTNAIKFTPEGGTVTLRKVSENKNTIFTITDTGIGIEPQRLKNLFESRKSGETKGTNSEKGTGLGLIICKDLIDKLSGKIEVTSEPGKGSTFTVTIPTRQ